MRYATSSLSRFSVAPRQGHLEMARKLFGYLKKYPKRGHIINSDSPKIALEYQQVEVQQDFGGQYRYFHEDLDPRFPEPKLPELDINLFCDADHGHNKLTGQSITGIIAMVGSTPALWSSK